MVLNLKMLTLPTNADVLETVSASNLLAVPGTDTLYSIKCKDCWQTLRLAVSRVTGSQFLVRSWRLF